MIEQALVFTKNILDQYLQNKYGISDSIVLINNITSADGSIPQQNQNKVIISLINIEQETNQPYYNRKNQLPNGDYVNSTPNDRFNLDLLITAMFDDYNETLKFLNASIMFFQANQSVEPESYSNLPPGINKLNFILEQLNYSQMHSLWTALGAKYTPSVVYKMKMIDIQANELTGTTSAINTMQNKVNS